MLPNAEWAHPFPLSPAHVASSVWPSPQSITYLFIMLTERSKVPSEPKKRDFFPAKKPVDARREVVGGAPGLRSTVGDIYGMYIA